MARMRKSDNRVECPLCCCMHNTRRGWFLYKSTHLWVGRLTFLHCPVRDMSFYKFYDENYRYVMWQQNAWGNIPDYEDIPF